MGNVLSNDTIKSYAILIIIVIVVLILCIIATVIAVFVNLAKMGGSSIQGVKYFASDLFNIK